MAAAAARRGSPVRPKSPAREARTSRAVIDVASFIKLLTLQCPGTGMESAGCPWLLRYLGIWWRWREPYSHLFKVWVRALQGPPAAFAKAPAESEHVPRLANALVPEEIVREQMTRFGTCGWMGGF